MSALKDDKGVKRMSEAERAALICSAGEAFAEICSPCGCGNQPPFHCMYCCEDFTEAQLEILRRHDMIFEDHPND